MRGEFKSIKHSFQILTLFIFAIAAHILAGGSVIATSQLLGQLLAICLASSLLRNVQLEGPSLAFLIAVVQSTSHFIVGGNTFNNQATMTFGHLLSGVVSYQLISNFHATWDRITENLRTIFLPAEIVRWIPQFRFVSSAIEVEPVFLTNFFSASLKYRGPPSRLEFHHAA
jgi:hypothetical protein